MLFLFRIMDTVIYTRWRKLIGAEGNRYFLFTNVYDFRIRIKNPLLGFRTLFKTISIILKRPCVNWSSFVKWYHHFTE